MKTSHSSNRDNNRKRFILGMIVLTTLAISFCTSLGIWNEFNELTNFSNKGIVSVLLSVGTLGAVITFFFKMVRSAEIKRTTNLT